MLNYIIRRLLLIIPTLIGITIVVFTTMALSPGGVGAALTNLEGNIKGKEREILRQFYIKKYGLDKPISVQYLRWLNSVSPIGFRIDDAGALGSFGLKLPDFGKSMVYRRPVTEVVAEALPQTLLLNLITVPIIYAVAINIGIAAARKRGGAFDVTTGTAFIALWSLPTMWVGVMLIGYLANRDYVQLFPTGGFHDIQADNFRFLPSTLQNVFQRGWLLDFVWHLVLPIICLTYGGFGYLSKLMRASVLENILADYARTARAKGLDESAVLYRHVLRNSLLPLITVAAGLLPGLLAGSVVVESIFSIQGMGKVTVDAISQRDFPIVMATTLVVSAISLLSVLVADVCYAIADPRVSYE